MTTFCEQYSKFETPEPDCNISPAEILFGRRLRDAFSFVNRLSKYENPSIRPIWRDAWQRKEEAMKVRYTHSIETLQKHTRTLPPLQPGDRVFIQNQRGSHPNKWDHSGTVMEVGDHDQHIVKVDGSGRLTLRNRRFLRKFIPVTTDIYKHPLPFCPTQTVPDVTTTPRLPVPPHTPLATAETSLSNPPTIDVPPTDVPIAPEATTPPAIPTKDTVPPSLPSSRSQRERKKVKFYVPEDGDWKER